MELSEIEILVMKLEELNKNISGCEGKRAELEKALEEYKRKSDVERRFHELSGLPYEDKSAELQEQLKALNAEYENALSEREKLREEILKGINNILIPMKKESAKVSQREVTFPYKDGKDYQAVISFIEKELDFGRPPVYVTFDPDGVKVVGVGDELSAMREVVDVIEELRAKAKEKLDLIIKSRHPVKSEPPITVKVIEQPSFKPKLVQSSPHFSKKKPKFLSFAR